MTLKQLLEKFPTEESCKKYLVARRWPDGLECPKCGNKKVFHVTHRPFHWVCKSGAETVNKETGELTTCHKRNGYRFSVITGTVFQDTKYPLKTWFQVAYLMMQSKKGMSAMQVQRIIGASSYKTAWYMCHRVRAAMKDDDFAKLLGIVEIDETYIGGKRANQHRDKKDPRGWGSRGKTPVIGAISRKGNVVCQMVEHVDTDTAEQFIRRVADKRVRLVATDESPVYRHLNAMGVKHETVDHKAEEWVRGLAHTQSIESFWSLIKRGIMGSYHNVSKKYLPLYLAEFQFRFNHRKSEDMFAEIIAGC
jgi:transposase-like protein